MNTRLIQDIKFYVNYLMFPLNKLYYHQYDHALQVMERSLYIWKKEWVSDEDLELLAIAWLFHDTGFVIQYDNNEYIGAKIAKNYLRTILYPEEKIEVIEKLINITNPKLKPKTLLEKIIKDADLDNLWRDDFTEKWNSLKKEIELIKNIRIKDPDWRHASLDLMEWHNYYTGTQIRERNKKLMENTKKLKSQLLQEFPE